jgi:lysophospholipase L1-like esterase
MTDGPVREKRRGAELLLLLGSLVFVLLVVGAAELAVRAFSAVDLLGNSKNLFVADAFGTSHGNAPDVEGSSFGLDVYTDEHGFRVPKGGLPGDAGKSEAILILGDSVGFGPAVEEPQTFAGLLRARFPQRRIYNASSIGYATHDYKNVVDAFLPQHGEVKAIVLVYCLNDVSMVSAQNIDRYLKTEQEKEKPPERNLTETLRSFTLLSDLNDYLRSRSKLYLFVRHRLLGTQMRDWKVVRQLYTPEHAGDVAKSAQDLAAIAASARERGIPFVLVIAPFEYQLREPQDPDTQVPQQMLGERLAAEGVAYIDARPFFDPGVASVDYFLGYDPMHFSAAGHRVIADVVAEALAR